MNFNKEARWNEWFAGLVDGNGCFYINKKNEISFELTIQCLDNRLLYIIKNKLKAGSIKLRSGSASVRYRVKQRLTILNIIHRLNGKLQNPKRLKKFQECCRLLNVDFIASATKISKQNGYLSGLIDSDGTVSISILKTDQENSQKKGKAGKIERLQQSRVFNQIYLRITSISKENMVFIQESYGFGKIYTEKPNKKNRSPNYKYHWTINSWDEFTTIQQYLIKNPLKSVKMHRIRLTSHYFHYRELQYHLKDLRSLEYKLWFKFCTSWFKYS